MSISRRTAIKGVGAALAASGALALSTIETSAVQHESEPEGLADVTTRLGEAMDEVSNLLTEWSNGSFRAIIGPDRDYWLQNRMLHVPARTEALIDAWCEATDHCTKLWKRVESATPGTPAREQRRMVWLAAYHERENALIEMLAALRKDRRQGALPKARRAAKVA